LNAHAMCTVYYIIMIQ